MLILHLEKFQSVHDEKYYPCVIFSVDGKRYFSTENFKYLLMSPRTLEDEGVTVIIDWDRNHEESVSLDPEMYELIQSPIYLNSEGDKVHLKYQGRESDRKLLVSVSKDEWSSIIEGLQQQIDRNEYKSSLSF